MEVLIRDAVLEDWEELARLNREEMGYDYPPEQTREKLLKLLKNSGDKILVAQYEGKLAGYLHLCDYDLLYADPLKNVMGIAVSADCRRMGIGRLLLEAGEKWAKETGAAGVRLNSGETRTGAHAFYRAMGYESRKKQMNFKKSFEE